MGNPKRVIFTLVLATAFLLPHPALARKAVILCYHTFLGKPNIATDFSIAEFRQHMTQLKANGAHFITLEQLKKHQYSGDKNVVVILDDGNASAYTAYKTVLKPMGIKPVFAIYPNIISHVKYAMTWTQLKEVVGNGCDIASHGYFHLYLTSEFAKKDPKGFAQEIAGSKQVLEKSLGIQITDFVYPFGLVSPEAKTLIKKSGYQYAYSITPKPVEWNKDSHYDLPRYMMTRAVAKSALGSI